nr:hypothetical protein [Planctomycetota bacterium]
MPIPPQPGQAQSGLRTADGRAMDLVMLEESGRSLRSVLKPGEVVTGRVIEQFANGSYLFALRGRQLVAASTVPLLRDSVVQFQVSDLGEEISLRMLTGPRSEAGGDSAAVAGRDARLGALGLSPDARGQPVLQALADAAAPLDTSRIQQALSHVRAAPAGQQATLAAAHALLARAGLPATPATLALATQALRPGLP